MRKNSKKSILITLLILSFTLFSLPLLPGVLTSSLPGKVQAVNGNGKSSDHSSVIVSTYSNATQGLKGEIARLGGKLRKEFKLLNGFSVDIPNSKSAAILDLLSKSPLVKAVTPNRDFISTAAQPLDVNRKTVKADVAQNSYDLDGSGIGVAVIDSGISPHQDLCLDPTLGLNSPSRVLYSQNFVDSEPTTYDLYGHGTHVAGIIAGNGSASLGAKVGYKGIAPKANLINLRVLDSQGMGTEDDIIVAIETAIALKATYNIRIINLSLGGPVLESYLNDPLCQAADNAWNNGILVVASAGNFGNTPYGSYGFITSPGNSPNVLTVGAINTRSTTDRSKQVITTYTSRGPTFVDHVIKPDIVAPGNRIISLIADNSTLALNYPTNKVSPSTYFDHPEGKPIRYYTLSGSSMAAPMVSGAAALLLQKDPTLDNHTLKMRMMSSTYKYGTKYDILSVGAGLLDLDKTLKKLGKANSSKSPYSKKDLNYQQVNLIVDALWSTQTEFSMSVVWGNGIVWGNTTNDPVTVWGGSVVWGNGIVWGNSSPLGDPVVANNVFNAASMADDCINGDPE
jgi:serine protease AprX